MEKSQKRQVAYKVKIKDILNGEYVREEGEWVPNYINLGDKKVSRVNLMAVVVLKQGAENPNQMSLLIDDGSGRISVRSFEEQGNFNDLNVGDFANVIGRPREYSGEKYIVSEVLKKVVNPSWIEVRKLELGKKVGVTVEVTKKQEPEKVEEESIGEDIDSKIFSLIKEIDSGGGADTQEVISRLKIEGGEEIINRLLKNGEVFEIKAGKLKILE